MEIDKIIFDEWRYMPFIDDSFIHCSESEVWKVSQLMDGTSWGTEE